MLDLAALPQHDAGHSRAKRTPKLPFDILWVVLGFLARDHPTLAACALVDKAWNTTASRALYAELRIGRFSTADHHRSISEYLLGFIPLIDTTPNIARFVRTLEISWPCDCRCLLPAVLDELPKLRRLVFTVPGRLPGRDRQAAGADGLARVVGTEHAGLWDAARVWVHAHTQTFHPDGDPYSLTTHSAGARALVLRFLSLFRAVDTLAVDHGAHALLQPLFEELVYPRGLRVRLLCLGPAFGGERFGELVRGAVARHPVAALCVHGEATDFVGRLLLQEGAAEALKVLRLTCASSSGEPFSASTSLGGGMARCHGLRLVQLSRFWCAREAARTFLEAVARAPKLDFLVLSVESERTALEWSRTVHIGWTAVDDTIVSAFSGRSVIVALSSPREKTAFTELIQRKLPRARTRGILRFVDEYPTHWKAYKEAIAALDMLNK